MTDVDINQVISSNAETGDPGVGVRTAEVARWSVEDAIAAGKAEGVELTAEHFAVLELLQQLYIERGVAPHARHLAGHLSDRFAQQGGSHYLYQLFPGGPVGQGSRLAGVPAPYDTKDLSFGSTF